MKNSICTSDYQLIDKDAIHRIFSAPYPKLREMPRLFIFDCCDGDDERHAYREDSLELKQDGAKQARVTDASDSPKNYTAADVTAPLELWVAGERNPDHKLIVLHAANKGFQAKLNSKDGSYLIHLFTQKVMQNQSRKGASKKYLCEMVDEIQTELADRGKQQIVPLYNDRTRYVTFAKNTEARDAVSSVIGGVVELEKQMSEVVQASVVKDGEKIEVVNPRVQQCVDCSSPASEGHLYDGLVYCQACFASYE